jgi:hypothetical protein
LKASISIPTGACVELAAENSYILLRHSRKQDPVIRFTTAEFAAFLDGAKNGEFDHLLEE